MTDNGIAWETPPNKHRGGPGQFKWIPLLEPLMARPGEWAKVDTKPNGHLARAMAYQLRHHKRPSTSVVVPPGRWEFTSRVLPDDSAAIYARYLGPEDGA
jgi:hypothetical protein